MASKKKAGQGMADFLGARKHAFGIVYPDPDTLKRASTIIQKCLGGNPTGDEKRNWAFAVNGVVKKLQATTQWPFEYMAKYERSPMELPAHVLVHACGKMCGPTRLC